MERSHISEKTLKTIGKDGLWTDKLSRLTHTDQLSQRLTGNSSNGIYFLVFLLLIFVQIILQIIVYYQYGWSAWSHVPFFLFIEIFLIFFAIWSIRRFKTYYDKTIELLEKNNILKSKKGFPSIAPRWLKLTIFAMAEGAMIFRIIFWDLRIFLENPSYLGNLDAPIMTIFNSGYIHGVFVIFYWLFFLIPISAEFVYMFIGAHVFFSKNFKNAKPTLDFTDPTLLNGLHPMGRFFLQSALIYYIALGVLLIYIWSSNWAFGLGTIAFFVGAWIFGLVLFYIPQLSIHLYMKREKQKKLEELAKKIRDDGSDDDGFLVAEPKNFKDAIAYIHRYVEYNHAEKLKLYPFNTTTIRDLLLIAVIPIGIQTIFWFINWWQILQS